MGHCGIPGNERVDAAASIGRQSRMFSKEIPGGDIEQWIKTRYGMREQVNDIKKDHHKTNQDRGSTLE